MNDEKDDRWHMPDTSEKREYPKVVEFKPDTVYKIEPVGGMRDDGTRWDNPLVLDIKSKSKKTGKPFMSHPLSCFITLMKYDGSKFIEEGKSVERTWFVSYDVVDDVKELVDNELYPFYVRKTAGYGESGKTKEIYEIFDGLNEIEGRKSGVKPREIVGADIEVDATNDILTMLSHLVNDVMEIKKMLKEK